MEFEKLRQAYISGELTPKSHVVNAERILPFPENKIVDFMSLPDSDREAGLALLKKGAWARLVLNGGMATRFGGKVKGICEVYEGFSFLELKLNHMSRMEALLGIPEIPVALMNSPATHQKTMDYLTEKSFFGRKKITVFVQVDAPRLTLEGKLFESMEGKDRAPRGHGDFLWALEESGTFDEWAKRGVSHFDFSNIDNLGAAIEPSLLGAFVNSQKMMGVEVVRKNPGDAGGAACLRDGVKGVLESIYFDQVFDQDILPFFSPNNLMYCLKSLQNFAKDPNSAIPWNVVVKKVEGQEVLQFERIAIDTVYAFNKNSSDDNVAFFLVPREGNQGRFYPVKSPDDLEKMRDKIKERLA